MTKRQDLYLQRRSRSEQSDQRQPNQAANISHQPRASPDSTSLASRIEFPTMTGDAVLNQTPVDLGIPFVHETEHPAFYRYRESYPRRNGSPRNCSSRAGDERSAVPVCV